jgi:hypothetical protein
MNQLHATYEGARNNVKLVFWEVKGEFDMTRGFDYMTMVSSQSMHSVKVVNASNNVLLDVREFSCFCYHYIDDVPCDYISKGYVESKTGHI